MTYIEHRAVELGSAVWRTSTYSGDQGDCVEVAALGGSTAVRDSKRPDGPVFLVSGPGWGRFLDSVKG
ncbi:DUF397 domain-containing protein [Streptomyces sp. H34-S4]|uniref:DUF397 domain-containing protein n=1 Tax=Streptomyces sp. H34-S4 TaxID=2996463 RepID=UPI00226F964A|nr:DUF397 domain-containing protein [Streptomyces sp. H34-S4]MCY0932669.1 DUF397 domain-containing protein [Streptomyces sp. H34-S4]